MFFVVCNFVIAIFVSGGGVLAYFGVLGAMVGLLCCGVGIVDITAVMFVDVASIDQSVKQSKNN